MAMSRKGAELVKSMLGEDTEYTVEEIMEDVDVLELTDMADELISEEITDQSRWMTDYKTVLRFGGNYLALYDSRGSTEMQDNYEDIDVRQVYPKAVTKIVYE